jgi:hypothetical protein
MISQSSMNWRTVQLIQKLSAKRMFLDLKEKFSKDSVENRVFINFYLSLRLALAQSHHV